MLKGVDDSDWQPDIDWPTAKAAGVSFAIHKATQGTRYVSETFASNRRESAVAGLGPIGLYHFAQDGDPVAQADHFCDVVGQLGPDEFAVLDIEANPDYFTLPQRSWPGFIVAFCEQVERRIGGPVAVYMSESPAKSMTAECARWPLWVAGYQTHAPTAWEDWQVGPWDSPVIWQWSSSGTVPGIGGTDENIAPDDLRDRLGLSSAPTPVPTPTPLKEDDMLRFICDGQDWVFPGPGRGDVFATSTMGQLAALDKAGVPAIGEVDQSAKDMFSALGRAK